MGVEPREPLIQTPITQCGEAEVNREHGLRLRKKLGGHAFDRRNARASFHKFHFWEAGYGLTPLVHFAEMAYNKKVKSSL